MKKLQKIVVLALCLALLACCLPLGASAEYAKLRYGSSGSGVSSMQTALKAQGYYAGDVDGKFGQGTLDAVLAFQAAKGLKADGIAGDATLTKLYGKPADPETPGIGKLPKSANTLYYTCTGTRVESLQKALKKLGYYSGDVDGVFGESTLKAVRKFQSAHGMHVDGLVGSKTIAKLNQLQSTKIKEKTTLSEGSRGDSVKNIQNKLEKLGFYKGGDEYGYMGASTIAAVIAFQKARGYSETGYVTQSMYTKIMNYEPGTPGPIYVTMRKGDRGSNVAALNSKLIGLGFSAPAGDEYTDETVAAVKAFQGSYNLKVDGVAGPKTQAKLAGL